MRPSYRDILEENLFQSALDLRLGRRFIFQQDNDPKHKAKITKEWLRDNSVTILDWPSQSPDLNPIQHLWRDLKMAVHQRSPSNLTELQRIPKSSLPWSHEIKSLTSDTIVAFGIYKTQNSLDYKQKFSSSGVEEVMGHSKRTGKLEEH
ncbi:hypothetical protein NFI96_001245 [Prochilodus magdalenae]|nr:hypothetical protein NFI96_001245 [Prochilodus magdalenae]